jgi:beta-N-acetylhexosaminidase
MAQAGPARAARAMYLRARLIAHELRGVGIDVNCMPLADVARDTTHPVLKNRLYGSAPDAVVGAGRAVAEGLMAGGVLPVLKHLPGYGLGEVDSHLTLPRVTAARAELEAVDFAAFRPLADLPLGMTAHIVYDAFGDDLPATFSPAMIRLIRDEIGFQGALMTDDLSMGALPGPIGARAARARAAGCDLILHCNGDRAEMAPVVAQAGALDGASLTRVEAALAARRAPDPLDIAAAEADLADLLDGEVYG